MGRREKLVASTALLAVLTVVGCGAPDLQGMRPATWKPVAEVVLVDQPAGWSASDIDHLAQSHHVVVRVVECSAGTAASVVRQALKLQPVGLIAVVKDGGIPTDVQDLAEENVNKRFEFVTNSPTSFQSLNVAVLRPQQDAVAYALGWLASALATNQTQTNVVGWLGNPGTDLDRRLFQATLAGMYAANSTVDVRPVTLATGGGVTPLPQVVLTDRALAAPEMNALTQAGVMVLSLVPQPGITTFAAVPTLPPESALDRDFAALASLNWHSGTRESTAPPLVRLNNAAVPTGVAQAFATVELELQSGTVVPATAWSNVPSSLQTAWLARFNIGS